MDFITPLAHLMTWIMHEYVILTLSLLGYFFYSNKGTPSRVLTVLLFTMMLSTYLKSLWQIPLNPNIARTGWAFPSGHMQGAVVFWGWLAWELKNRSLSYTVVVLLLAYASAVVHLGYHSWDDILGGVVFGGLTLPVYALIIKTLPNSKKTLLPAWMALLGIPLMRALPHAFSHLWMAQGALWGLSIGWTLLERTPQNKLPDSAQSFSTFLFALLGIFLTYGFFVLLKPYAKPQTLAFFKFCSLAIWASYGAQSTVARWMRTHAKEEARYARAFTK